MPFFVYRRIRAMFYFTPDYLHFTFRCQKEQICSQIEHQICKILSNFAVEYDIYETAGRNYGLII